MERISDSGDSLLLPGVAPETITPPALPTLHLPRPHLYRFLEQDAPKALIVMAPVGFGKSTLGAEWAHANPRSIWFESTAYDDIQTTLHRMICAIRRISPSFAEWYHVDRNVEKNLEATIKRMTQEVADIDDNVNFIIDGLEKMPAANARFVQIWTDNLPLNVRTLSLRRNAPLISYERAVELGVLKYLAAFDIRFSDEELIALKDLYRIDMDDDELIATAKSLNGWPAGVTIYLEAVARMTGSLDERELNSTITKFLPRDLVDVFRSKSGLQKLGTQNLINLLERAGYPGFTIRGRSAQALTPREVEILKLLNSDRTVAKIAQDLFISINTLKSHLKSIYKKLEVANRDEAVLRAHESALI